MSTAMYAQEIPVSNSVLSEGDWYKLKATKAGMYKITGQQLVNWGISIGEIIPDQIQLFGVPSGNLPQSNAVNFPYDPSEMTIIVESGSDGTFNLNDYLIFYSPGAHRLIPNQESKEYDLAFNNYDNDYYVLLRINGKSSRKEITLNENTWDATQIIETSDVGTFFKQEKLSKLLSGRDWLGDYFSASTNERSYVVSDWKPVSNSTIKVKAEMVGYSYLQASFDVGLNGFQLGQIPVMQVSDYRYDLKGRLVKGNYSIASSLITGDPVVSIKFNPNTGAKISEGNLMNIVVQGEIALNHSSVQTTFYSFKSVDQLNSNYRVKTTSSYTDLVRIEDDLTISYQPYQEEVGGVIFGSSNNLNLGYNLFDRNKSLLIPEYKEKISTQNIKNTSAVEFLIITAPEFESYANQLANLRRSTNQLDVGVVTTTQIFNEFSGGRIDPTAIRNFIRYMYWRSDSPQYLQNVLLFGKGHFDVKNIYETDNNFVPIYESRDFLHPLKTYGSDDYYTFLEENEGEWEENSEGDHTMEIGIGRLPVTNAQEASNVLKKLEYYSKNFDSEPMWKSNVAFLADDGDFNTHMSQADQLATFVDTTYSGIQPKRIFLDAYIQEAKPGGETSEDMKQAIKKQVQEGALIVNYTGHGGPSGLMQERNVFDKFTMEDWDNKSKLPLLVTATCEFGRHDNPFFISAGELALMQPSGGGIGLVTTSRPVFSSTNFILNKAFYGEVFKQENGQNLTLGEIFKRTKNQSNNGVNNRNFSLLGDPSMKLAYPELRAVVNEINQGDPDLTTLGAMNITTLKGSIVDNENTLSSGFNGEIQVKLFDKKTSKVTLGDENQPFQFSEWQTLLFSGKAEVQNGVFDINFIVPKNINYEFGKGKILLFAQTNDGDLKASGSNLKLVIGGSENNTVTDFTGPSISAFLDTRDFMPGDQTGKDALLIVDFYDESGISTTGIGVDQNVEAILDDTVHIVLNEYYSANSNDFTKGSLNFLLEDLAPGRHELVILARDVYGNAGKTSSYFYVNGKKGIEILEISTAPNPFRINSTISFTHNRFGDDVIVKYILFSSVGKMLEDETYLFEKSASNIEIKSIYGQLNNGMQLEQGLYFVQLVVQSKADGSKNSKIAKLIYMN